MYTDRVEEKTPMTVQGRNLQRPQLCVNFNDRTETWDDHVCIGQNCDERKQEKTIMRSFTGANYDRLLKKTATAAYTVCNG